MGLRRPSAREFAVQRIGQVVTLKPAVLDVVAQPLAKRGRTLQLARRLRSHRRLKHTTQNLLVLKRSLFHTTDYLTFLSLDLYTLALLIDCQLK
jgi:hypothetical protein